MRAVAAAPTAVKLFGAVTLTLNDSAASFRVSWLTRTVTVLVAAASPSASVAAKVTVPPRSDAAVKSSLADATVPLPPPCVTAQVTVCAESKLSPVSVMSNRAVPPSLMSPLSPEARVTVKVRTVSTLVIVTVAALPGEAAAVMPRCAGLLSVTTMVSLSASFAAVASTWS